AGRRRMAPNHARQGLVRALGTLVSRFVGGPLARGRWLRHQASVHVCRAGGRPGGGVPGIPCAWASGRPPRTGAARRVDHLHGRGGARHKRSSGIRSGESARGPLWAGNAGLLSRLRSELLAPAHVSAAAGPEDQRRLPQMGPGGPRSLCQRDRAGRGDRHRRVRLRLRAADPV
ncbi:MAG: hypothetical protein AVDCRST_MAG05-234, partial [uncultured Rubrobacteraceae bacterium]